MKMIREEGTDKLERSYDKRRGVSECPQVGFLREREGT